MEEFQDFDKPPSSSQVQQKITRLRCYYTAGAGCSKNNKVERSKTSGGDTDSVYPATWKFFESLEFLKDNLIIRTTKNTHGDDSSAYTVNNPPSLKSQRELKQEESR